MEKSEKANEQDVTGLRERFKKAYENIPVKLRNHFMEDFAATHKVAAVTAKAKGNGFATVTEWECRWIEGYNPYTRKSSVELAAA